MSPYVATWPSGIDSTAVSTASTYSSRSITEVTVIGVALRRSSSYSSPAAASHSSWPRVYALGQAKPGPDLGTAQRRHLGRRRTPVRQLLQKCGGDLGDLGGGLLQRATGGGADAADAADLAYVLQSRGVDLLRR